MWKYRNSAWDKINIRPLAQWSWWEEEHDYHEHAYIYILKEKKLSYAFWGEVIINVCYMLNMSPTKILDMVPKETWSSHTIYVKHLRIFGSLCFKHITYQQRKKLEDKNESMILLDYHTSSYYKLYNTFTQRIVASINVIINKHGCWN